MFQAVARRVRGAEKLHVHALRNSTAREFRRAEFFAAFLPDGFGRVRSEQAVNAENPFEFEVRPVIQGVAERLGHGFGPLGELVPVGRAARAVFF